MSVGFSPRFGCGTSQQPQFQGIGRKSLVAGAVAAGMALTACGGGNQSAADGPQKRLESFAKALSQDVNSGAFADNLTVKSVYKNGDELQITLKDKHGKTYEVGQVKNDGPKALETYVHQGDKSIGCYEPEGTKQQMLRSPDLEPVVISGDPIVATGCKAVKDLLKAAQAAVQSKKS